MNATAFTHLLTWWIETLADALLRRIWLRYHAALAANDIARASSIFRRFSNLVARHNWCPCRIEYWTDGQLVVSAGPRADDDYFDEEALA